MKKCGEKYIMQRSCVEMFPHEKHGHKSVLSQFMQFCHKISFGAIYAVLSQNNFVTIYMFLRREKLSQTLFLWRKKDKYQVCVVIKCQENYFQLCSVCRQCCGGDRWSNHMQVFNQQISSMKINHKMSIIIYHINHNISNIRN